VLSELARLGRDPRLFQPRSRYREYARRLGRTERFFDSEALGDEFAGIAGGAGGPMSSMEAPFGELGVAAVDFDGDNARKVELDLADDINGLSEKKQDAREAAADDQWER